jgi:uncharacterized membrane protein
LETSNAAAESFAKPELFESTLHGIAVFFEAGGVAVMVLGLLLASVQGLRQTARGAKLSEIYHPFRTTLARSILLGLEFLVAADIIGTVAVEPTIQNLLVLGLIVVIRTFLSFALQIEISGRLPWRSTIREEIKPEASQE